MSVNEMNLALVREKRSSGSRLLGLAALVGAPMLLALFLSGAGAQVGDAAPKTWRDQLLAVTGVLYIGGWMCGAIGMRRLRVTGDTLTGKILFVIQITLLSFALLFSAMEVGGFDYENGGLIFAVTDAGWPLSHLLMIAVGILVWRAKIWTRWRLRVAPFLVGLALPLTLALGGLVGAEIGRFLFGALTGVGLGIIGWQLIKKAE